MNRGLKLYDKFLASTRIYSSVEAAEMTGKCLEFMCRNRRKFRFTEKIDRAGGKSPQALYHASREKAEKALTVFNAEARRRRAS